jgi:MraZ protein
MFLGQFYHNLDEKGRLIMPARFREFLSASGGAYLLRGFDHNLMVVTAATFNTMYERVNATSLTDPTSRLLRRQIFSGAALVEFDKLGRILVPQFLRDYAGINEEAVVIGAGDYAEIWSPEMWVSQTDLLNDVEATADRFTAFDIFSK